MPKHVPKPPSQEIIELQDYINSVYSNKVHKNVSAKQNDNPAAPVITNPHEYKSSAHCKNCRSIYYKQYYERNKEKISADRAAWNKKWYWSNREEILESYRERSRIERANCPTIILTLEEKIIRSRKWARKATIRKLYGLALEEYEALFNGRCAICKKETVIGHGQAGLDHNHETGQLREFLCGNCNRGLGNIKENVGSAKRAIKYLRAGSMCDDDDNPIKHTKDFRRFHSAICKEILAYQHNRCLICETVLDKFNVDHDHSNGFVRGLLCPNCNRFLGNVKEDPKIIKAMIRYIKKWSEPCNATLVGK